MRIECGWHGIGLEGDYVVHMPLVNGYYSILGGWIYSALG